MTLKPLEGSVCQRLLFPASIQVQSSKSNQVAYNPLQNFSFLPSYIMYFMFLLQCIKLDLTACLNLGK